MASYRLEWRRSAALASVGCIRILTAVSALAEDPYPPGCAKLSGSQRSFMIRIGNYRVLYDVYDRLLILEVIKVGHKKDVYRD